MLHGAGTLVCVRGCNKARVGKGLVARGPAGGGPHLDELHELEHDAPRLCRHALGRLWRLLLLSPCCCCAARALLLLLLGLLCPILLKELERVGLGRQSRAVLLCIPCLPCPCNA